MTAPKTSASLTVSDIRHLFETSADANVVRDCVRAIGAGAGGVFESEMKDYQRTGATNRLVTAHNVMCSPRVFTPYHGYTIASVTFTQPYYIDGMFIRSGYNVLSENSSINVMPGACWFMNIADALRGIDCLIEAGGSPRPPYKEDEGVGKRFWELMKERRTAHLGSTEAPRYTR